MEQKIIIRIPIPSNQTNNIPTSIIGVKNTNDKNEVAYAAAVLKDVDIDRMEDEKDVYKKYAIFATSKIETVYSQVKHSGLHDFINKEYVMPRVDEVLREIKRFALENYGIERPQKVSVLKDFDA